MSGVGRKKHNSVPKGKGQRAGNEAAQALDDVLGHPFWAQLPKAIVVGLERISDVFEKGEFDEELADRVVRALRLVAERGEFGEPEQAFLNAARTAFEGNKGFAATAIDFMQTVARSVDPDNTRAPEQTQDRLDLVRYIYFAARDKPELLELLNDSVYKTDPTVADNPHVNKLLNGLVGHGCLKTWPEKEAVKLLLSQLRRNWTEDRCEAARNTIANAQYFRDLTDAQVRQFIEQSRKEHPKDSAKLVAVARGLRATYSERTVRRFEVVCYTMLNACKGIHA